MLILFTIFKDEMHASWMEEELWSVVFKRWEVVLAHDLCGLAYPKTLLVGKMHGVRDEIFLLSQFDEY
jgi:hypothetical protein